MLRLKKLVTGLLCTIMPQVILPAAQAQVAVPQAQAGILYVSIPGIGVEVYNPATRTLLTTVRLSKPTALAFGPNGNLFIGDNGNRTVDQFNQTTLTSFASNPSGVLGLTFGLDGNLLAVGQSGSIQKFNGTTGGLVGTFAMGALAFPGCLKLAPNGYLYTCDRVTASVVVFNGVTGGGPLANIGTGGAAPLDLTIGPNGNLYATVGSNVLQISPTGASVFAKGFSSAYGLAFGPNGHLYVSDVGTNTISELDGTTGSLVGQFKVDGPPTFMTFAPFTRTVK